MKRLIFWLSCSVVIALSSCNNPENGGGEPTYPTATGNGAMRVFMDDLEQKISNARENRDAHQVYRLKSIDHQQISTGYINWDFLEVYYDNEGLHSALLAGTPEKGNRLEEFIFGEDGKLIFSEFRPAADSNQVSEESLKLYFIQDKLAKALNENNEELNVEGDTVKLQAMKMMKEAEAIRELLANKNLKL